MENGVDVFVVRGWYLWYDGIFGWFCVVGDKLDVMRFLRDYYNKNVDMEVDLMMICLGFFVVKYF